MIRSIAVIAAAGALAACGASPSPAPSPPAPGPVTALGGSDSSQSRSFHLDAGRYRVTWKADQAGSRLSGEVIVRHLLGSAPPGGVYDNAQAPIVATLTAPGTDIETLPAGQYVLVVAVIAPAPWTVTVARA